MTSGERLVLSAARGDRESAPAAWEAWLTGHDLDRVDPGTFAALAAVARNLGRHGVSHREASRLKGIFKYAWTQAQVTARDLRVLQPALGGGGVRAVSLRGLPVVVRYLGESGSLPVDQVDFLIVPGALDSAAGVLQRLGWRPAGPIPPARIRWVYQRLAFEAPGRRRVVLHWRVLPLGGPVRLEADLIERAAPFDAEGVETLLLDPVDQFVAEAARRGDLAPAEALRWALESGAVLDAVASAGRMPDLEARAREAGQEQAVRDAMELLRSGTGTGTGTTGPAPGLPPGNPLSRLRGAVSRNWRRYRAVCRAEARPAGPWDFLGFSAALYRHAWGVPRTAGLPVEAFRRLLGRRAG